MSAVKTIGIGIGICLLVNCILFPIRYLILLPNYDIPYYFTELLNLSRILLCGMGGMVLFRIRCGSNLGRKRSLGDSINTFLKKYHHAAMILLVFIVVLLNDNMFWRNFTNQFESRMAVYPEGPWYNVFICENVFPLFAINAYVVFVIKCSLQEI